MRTETRTLTPEDARQLLDNSKTNNRTLTQAAINRYVKDMVDGNWKLSADGISIDTAGNILNGHHRLHAVIQSKTAQEFRVTYDADPETFDVYDTGKNRTGKDILVLQGLESRTARIISSAIPLIISWERNKILTKTIDQRQNGNANHTIREFYDNNKGVYISAKFTQSLPRHAKLLRESVACFLHYEISKIATLSDADRYLKLVATGDGICSDNIIYALRQMLTYHITDARRLHDTQIIKLAIHTYKLWKKDTRYKDPMATLRKITVDSDVDFV
jgi:hypothetical protein